MTPLPPLLPLFERALLIRRFEELLLELFAAGKLNGTVHTCIGQEWSGIAVAQTARPGDTIFSNHRGHGHYLAFRAQTERLLAEVMGRAAGLCGGFGGSQHLHDAGFFSNGVVGGMSPIAVGSAWAHRAQAAGNISIVFHGDGALGEGVVYEAMNLASAWRLPVLWVIECNGYAQSTDCRHTLAGTIAGRAAAFGLRHFHGLTDTPAPLVETAAAAVQHVRTSGTPALLEIETFRLASHSKGDDNRAPELIAAARARDPLTLWEAEDPAAFARADAAIRASLRAMAERCGALPRCTFTPRRAAANTAPKWQTLSAAPVGATDDRRFSALLHDTLVAGFTAHPDLVMFGEDIEGSYGGAFKVTGDLSARFPDRVRNTPISEAAIVGAATGVALSGRRALVEIMFGDFLSLTLDQLLQHACKFETMYGGAVRVPLIVRTPMGGRRGYGPTHSQSIEAHFLGTPGLTVLALNGRVSPARLYDPLLAAPPGPTLVLENKVLYTRPLRVTAPAGFAVALSDERFPTVQISPRDAAAQATIVCYGGMLDLAEESLARAFAEQELLVEIVCPAQLAPLGLAPIAESVRRTGRLLLVEEGRTFAAFGSEVIAQLAEQRVRFEVRRLGYVDYIPSCLERENELLPSVDAILRALAELCHE